MHGFGLLGHVLAGLGEGFALKELGDIFTGTSEPEFGWIEGLALCNVQFSQLGGFRDFGFQALGVFL